MNNQKKTPIQIEYEAYRSAGGGPAGIRAICQATGVHAIDAKILAQVCRFDDLMAEGVTEYGGEGTQAVLDRAEAGKHEVAKASLDFWMAQVSEAFEAVGAPLTATSNSLLVVEDATAQQGQLYWQAVEAVRHLFFGKATRGEAFGPIERVQQKLGRSIEEAYGLSDGPFYNMAKTYWTFKLGVQDLVPDYTALLLTQVLLKVELDIASVFFPTPGLTRLPVRFRAWKQREMLQQYAPEIDVDRFLSENPVLKGKATQKGCLGVVIGLLVICAVAAAIARLAWAMIQ